jgi:hypothetical protein
MNFTNGISPVEIRFFIHYWLHISIEVYKTRLSFQQILHCKSYIYISCQMKFDNLTKLFVLISCSKIEIFFRRSLFLSIQNQESPALFSTCIHYSRKILHFYCLTEFMKKENSYLILFWFQWWHENSSWLTSKLSYGILIWTTEISIKENLRKPQKINSTFFFLSWTMSK